MLRTVSRDSLARNSVLIMASTVGTAGLGYLYWLLAARQLAQPAIGTATALISVSTVVSMVSNLGLGHMFIQRLPGTGVLEWSRIVGAGLLTGCGATAAVSFAAAGVLPSIAGNFAFLRSSSGVAALVVTSVALTATTLLDNVFVAHRASHGMFTRNLALAAGKLATLGLLTWAGYGGAGVVLLAWTLPSLAVTAYTMTTMLGRLRPGARLTAAGIGAELRHVQGSLSGHHLINLAQAGPTALLPVLVTARLGAEANAQFYVAWMTASVLFMVSPAVASALYAERTNAAAAGLPRASVVVLAVTGLPALVLFFAGERILGLFSAGYAAEGALLLKILVLAALPDAITNLAVAHWRSLGEFRRCLRLNLLMATVCVTLTWLWLPGTGIEAAGIAWLVGQTAGALVVALRSVRSWRKAPTA
ncbi:lipopolysaccharide biosynthesis protein [Paractinoplanes lichenicola]|uniref:Sugar transporter n=1 Tax=Paractinoplanes lichenicola TaxID=2802976 RepID=A0ABS1VI47_9ACTN|nr:sugar transporter [Actinoplanes lichenicola]MBL7253965.1 sugar transporter [Actinoplanes lichenicola]